MRRLCQPQDVLRLWMEKWGPLSPTLQDTFLDKYETEELCMFPLDEVGRAIRGHQKLAEALRAARTGRTPVTATRSRTKNVGGRWTFEQPPTPPAPEPVMIGLTALQPIEEIQVCESCERPIDRNGRCACT